MRSDLTEVLDCALSRLAAGEALADILTTYPRQAPALKPLLEAAQALEVLRPVPMPPAQVLELRRQAFLSDAERIRRRRSAHRPASAVSRWLSAWWERLMLALGLSGRPFARLAVTFVLAFGLVCTLGSVGLVAARHSLPGSPLYPVKLLSEEIGLSLTSDVTRKADRYLSLALERAQEMTRLAQAGRTIAPVTLERMKARLEQALQLAAQLDDAQLRSWLGGAQRALLNQASALQQAQLEATESSRASLEQAATQLEQAGKQAEVGQKDLQRFRQQRGVGLPAESAPPSGPPAIPSPPPERPMPATERGAEPSSTVPGIHLAPGATPSPEPAAGTAPAGPHQQNGSPSEEPDATQPGGRVRSGGPDGDGGAGESGGGGDAGYELEQGSSGDAGKQGTEGGSLGGSSRQGR